MNILHVQVVGGHCIRHRIVGQALSVGREREGGREREKREGGKERREREGEREKRGREGERESVK